jgi:hypothetical protein
MLCIHLNRGFLSLHTAGSPGGDGPPLVVITQLREPFAETEKSHAQAGVTAAVVLGAFLVGLALAGLVSGVRYWVVHKLHPKVGCIVRAISNQHL